ncbi:hypothetical protein [Flavobacterium selenitireducens]|uniref:hypothetical protein n=1 Tax=Flavobacterium selenitireducens TaxID=2722704 RepID=UPI00168B522C|nr:hypothetical protein [Flavobacterium selenitireducens]MBD3582305.1 hypothetical protein [Flavobacterium selenitireducens]
MRTLSVYTLFTCITVNLVSAQKITNDSIMYLDEVSVSRHEEVVIKTKGRRGETRGFQNEKFQFVSLVEGIPKGEISSLVLYFKNPEFRDYDDVEYELRLLILEVGKNGSPGNAISDTDLRFKIKSGNKNKVELDLRALNLESRNRLFFGFEIIEYNGKIPLILDFWETRTEVSFFKDRENEWKRPSGFLATLKMELAIWPID